jgi:hypothetical protein
VNEVTRAAGRRAAAAYLRQLLLKQGSYRQAWEKYVIRARGDSINNLAVAEVLARHLSSAPDGPGGARVQARQLKDTVARALSGRVVSQSALSLFVDAFGISEHEADRLWRLWSGSATISVLAGARAMAPQAEQTLAQALGPRRHQTVSMHDHVLVGADGRLERTRTIQVIEAITMGVGAFPFLYDTDALTVEVGQGCSGLSGQLRQLGPALFATDIILARTLDLGDTLTMEYWVTYRYPGRLSDPHEREYRRGVLRHLENYDMRVEFHPDRLPERLWWARWDGLDGEIVQQQEVALDAQHAAQRYLRSLDRTVVGFRWQW